jgi:hypothetical protein
MSLQITTHRYIKTNDLLPSSPFGGIAAGSILRPKPGFRGQLIFINENSLTASIMMKPELALRRKGTSRNLMPQKFQAWSARRGKARPMA